MFGSADIFGLYTIDETEEAAANRRRRQELPTADDIAMRNVEYLLDAQRVAAEIVTNLCSSEEEGIYLPINSLDRKFVFY